MRLFSATVLIYGLSVSAVVSGLSDEYLFERLSSEDFLRSYEVNSVSFAIKKRLVDGEITLPSTLNDLDPVYFGVKIPSYLELSYATKSKNSATLDMQGEQAIIFDPSGLTDDDWLSSNECAANPWAASTDFCHRSDLYAEIDTTDYALSFSKESQSRLDRVVQQLIDGKIIAGRFPANIGGSLQPFGTLIQLHQAAGYAGSAGSCSGLFSFDGAVFTCEHLFALDGTPIFYQVNSASEAVVYINLPFTKLNGQPHRVARIVQI